MDANEIRTVHSMLHLIFHRNKNQHQRAKWWKWLSMLKRTTWDIASSIDSAQTNAADSHRRHLAVHLIPRCYLAFSTVVADNQFSTLGIVLLAALARLAKVTRVNHEPTAQPMTEKSKTIPVASTEDFGERVCRTVDDDHGVGNGPAQTCHPSKSELDTVRRSTENRNDLTKTTKKSKKRKKNAIDDLFSGLV